jgi:dCMP deaminase
MQVAAVVAGRATCIRRQIGALLVKDKRILTTGYNGAPTGLPHCLDLGCAREHLPSGIRHELCRGLHAEQNALLQAARHGIRVDGATLYSTTEPCSLCAKMLINAGIVRVVYGHEYPDELARSMLLASGVEKVQIQPAATGPGCGRG